MMFEKPFTVARVHLNHVVANFKTLRGLLSADQCVLPVIKANAYGHGSVAVAQALAAAGVTQFFVTNVEEGVQLRQAGITAQIFVLNGILAALAEYEQFQLVPILHHHGELHAVRDHLVKHGRVMTGFSIGLKFDTGMSRLGFLPTDVARVFDFLQSDLQGVSVACVMSHLARADDGPEYTQQQFSLFQSLKSVIQEKYDAASQIKFSICNSAALLDKCSKDSDWVRPGLALYGAYPHVRQRSAVNLQAALTLESRLIELKTVPAHATVGYGGTFTTQRVSQIAVLPFGYADGYPRMLSNRAQVLVRGQRVPVVGRVSMALTTVDVTDVPGVSVGDVVTLIGTQGEQTIRVEDVATWADTISYEILTGLKPQLYREYVTA